MPLFSSREKWPAERSSLLAIVSPWHLIPLAARCGSVRRASSHHLHVSDLAVAKQGFEPAMGSSRHVLRSSVDVLEEQHQRSQRRFHY